MSTFVSTTKHCAVNTQLTPIMFLQVIIHHIFDVIKQWLNRFVVLSIKLVYCALAPSSSLSMLFCQINQKADVAEDACSLHPGLWCFWDLHFNWCFRQQTTHSWINYKNIKHDPPRNTFIFFIQWVNPLVICLLS